MPGAGRCHIANDGVCAERKAAHGSRIQLMLTDEIEHRQAGQTATFSSEGGGSAIDVVIAGGARRKLELAQSERNTGQHLEQCFAMGKGHHLILSRWRKPPVTKNKMVKIV